MDPSSLIKSVAGIALAVFSAPGFSTGLSSTACDYSPFLEQIAPAIRARFSPAKELGSGIDARVFEGKMPGGPFSFPQIGRPGDPIAIKVPYFTGDEALDKLTADSIRHEAGILAELFRLETKRKTHFFVRGILDPQTGVLVMEKLDGARLKDWAQQPHTRGEKDRVTAQLREALSLLRDAGLVHRELTDENIFVLGDGSVCIIDFGVSAKQGTTPAYAQRFDPSPFSPPSHLIPEPAQFSEDELAVQRLTASELR